MQHIVLLLELRWCWLFQRRQRTRPGIFVFECSSCKNDAQFFSSISMDVPLHSRFIRLALGPMDSFALVFCLPMSVPTDRTRLGSTTKRKTLCFVAVPLPRPKLSFTTLSTLSDAYWKLGRYAIPLTLSVSEEIHCDDVLYVHTSQNGRPTLSTCH